AACRDVLETNRYYLPGVSPRLGHSRRRRSVSFAAAAAAARPALPARVRAFRGVPLPRTRHYAADLLPHNDLFVRLLDHPALGDAPVLPVFFPAALSERGY